MIALEKLRKVDDFDWTAISPPTSIKPGERTGNYRLGTDTMVVDAADNGHISREDFAVAILDEIENPKYVRQQVYGRLLARRSRLRPRRDQNREDQT